MSYCNECGKYFKSLTNNNLICRHINSKKHQKNRLKNDNKSYNTLLALVRNNVDSNLIGEINKRVINNFYKKNNNIYKRDNEIEYEELNTLEDKLLYNKYDNLSKPQIEQICSNNHIVNRLGLKDKSNIQLDSIRNTIKCVDLTHRKIYDWEISKIWFPKMLDFKLRLEKMLMITYHLINQRIVDKYEVNCNYYNDIHYYMEELYGKNHNKTIENVIQELEDLLDNAPISMVF